MADSPPLSDSSTDAAALPVAAGGGRGGFEPTQWSLVMAAGAQAPVSAAALEKLCRAYLPPVHAFVRREGYSPHDAEDLTQEFFRRLLSSDSFATVSREKGRFRSWLIGALKHFLHSEWRRTMTQKRGGGRAALSLDAMDPAVRQGCEPVEGETPETAYDRRWAETLLARVNARMRREYALAAQSDRWEVLKVYLLQGTGAPSYGETAARLGMHEGAVKSAIYKMRQRFGIFLRHEVAQTVADPADVEDELRALLRTL